VAQLSVTHALALHLLRAVRSAHALDSDLFAIQHSRVNLPERAAAQKALPVEAVCRSAERRRCVLLHNGGHGRCCPRGSSAGKDSARL
jgi:hypothetical protein